MATTLLAAINERFAASAAAADVADTGGLWFGQTPEEKYGFPRIILWHMGEKPALQTMTTTNDAYREEGHFQFEIYHTDLDAAEATATKIKTNFDVVGTTDRTLKIGNAPLSLVRTNYQVATTGEKSPDDKPIFQVVVEYESHVTKIIGTN